MFGGVVLRTSGNDEMIQAGYSSKLPLILKEQERIFRIARKKATSNLANETMIATLPYSISSLPVVKYSASKALNKGAIKKQQQRIRQDILGKDGKGWKRAPIAGDGSILASKIKGDSRMPLVVPTGSGRRKKSPPPKPVNILQSADAVRRWLKENTYLAWRRGSATRIRKRGAKLRWVEKSALLAAAKYLSDTAAGLLSGWAALARLSNNTKFAQLVSHRQKPNAPGSASMKNSDDKITVSVVNRGLPTAASVQKYQREQVDAWIPKKWEYAIANETKYAVEALDKFIKKLK